MSVNSVKGFRLTDGSTAKYDYAYLENIITDTELTQEGVAADGKAVGDAIDEVMEELSDVKSDLTVFSGRKDIHLSYVTWTDNYSINKYGEITSLANFRYSSLIPVEGKLYDILTSLSVVGYYTTRIHAYDENEEWISQIGYHVTNGETGTFVFSFNGEVEGIKYIRISTSVNVSVLYIAPSSTMRYVNPLMRIGITEWEIGLYSVGYGTKEYNSARIRTVDYISDHADSIVTDPNRLTMWVLAWDKDDNYIGAWTGSSFIKDVNQLIMKSYWDLQTIKQQYPTYKFKLCARSTINSTESLSVQHGNYIFIANNSFIDKRVGNLVNDIEFLESITESKNLYGYVAWTDNYSINSSGEIIENNGFRYSSLVPVKNDICTLKYECLDNAQNIFTRIHFYNSSGVWQGQIEVFETLRILGVHTETFVVPSTGFIRISTGAHRRTDVKALYLGQTVQSKLDDINEDNLSKQAKAIGLHTVPDSVGALNAVKRARQLTDMRWIPAGDFERTFLCTGDTGEAATHSYYRGTFSEGKEYTGVPYTARIRLGIEVPIDVFATGVANENSAQIVESTFIGEQQTSYYGVVCSDLVSYTMDIPGTGT